MRLEELVRGHEELQVAVRHPVPQRIQVLTGHTGLEHGRPAAVPHGDVQMVFAVPEQNRDVRSECAKIFQL